MLKAQAEIPRSLWAVAVVGIFVAIMFLLISQSFQDLAKQIALESAEVVAKDLAGFITISGAAPEEIKITYKPSTKFSYDVEIGGRIVRVSSLLDGDYREGPRIFVWEFDPLPWKEKTTIDTTANFKNEKNFVIQKFVKDGKYVYSVTNG